jgi:hypothetical protein
VLKKIWILRQRPSVELMLEVVVRYFLVNRKKMKNAFSIKKTILLSTVD